MSSEINLDSVDFDELIKAYRTSIASCDTFKPSLHKTIFSRKNDFLHFVKKTSLRIDLSELEERTQKATQNIKPMEAGGNVEVKVEVKWGDKDGPSVSVAASGEIHDNNGNYAKGEIKQDSNGDGSVSVSAGHKEEENTPK